MGFPPVRVHTHRALSRAEACCRAPQLSTCTSLTCGARAGGAGGSALALVMGVWTERQPELRGFYQINLTATALALLLASGHPALSEIQASMGPLLRA